MSEATLRVALTFDAEHPDRPWCPPGNIERIMDRLAEEQVRATFFIQGRWAQSQPEAAARIAADGHLIGNHSHYHARMSLLSEAGSRTDIQDAQRCIIEATGVDPRPWFRFPFGDAHDDPVRRSLASQLGYQNVYWNVALEDWEPHRTVEAIAADAIEGVRAHGDGAVVLLHTWPGGTGDAVGPMIQGMKELGATFVTVDALEELPR
jgi:peptidoglycan-N-acetylglucosamine deacetylase